MKNTIDRQEVLVGAIAGTLDSEPERAAHNSGDRLEVLTVNSTLDPGFGPVGRVPDHNDTPVLAVVRKTGAGAVNELFQKKQLPIGLGRGYTIRHGKEV